MLGDIKSKKILLIDDVEDNGITIQKIKEKLLEIGALEVKRNKRKNKILC